MNEYSLAKVQLDNNFHFGKYFLFRANFNHFWWTKDIFRAKKRLFHTKDFLFGRIKFCHFRIPLPIQIKKM